MPPTTSDVEKILNRVHDWVRAADQKAYVLVLIQTAVPAVLADTLKDWYINPANIPYRVPVVGATVGWLASLIFCALTILARTGWKGRKSVTYFATIECWKLEEYRRELNDVTDDGYRNDLIDQVWISSRICSLKHFFLRVANIVFLISAGVMIGCYAYRAIRG